MLKQEDERTYTGKAYSITFSQNIFMEEDESKNCVDYENRKLESYASCDEEFVAYSLRNYPGVLPIWATSEVENATSRASLTGDHKMFATILFNLFSGATSSKCNAPCKTTSVASTLVFEDKWPIMDDNEVNYIDFSFAPTVMITEIAFPKPVITTFLSSFGGSMGFWLGIGVLQVVSSIIAYFPRIFTDIFHSSNTCVS